jgi:peptidoglycan/LPS O-acetylase OafA/YrhL
MEANKNRDIEILRAIAISFVLVFHWAPHALARLGTIGEQFPHFTGLWSGVDLFFCVSGYVITSSLIRDFDRTAQSRRFASFALPFWIRRMWRLWPSAWLWILFSVIAAYEFNSTGIFGVPRNTANDAAMAVFNLYNLHHFFCGHDQSCGSLSVYWSLSLEEQFYFVFPFLFFFLRRGALTLFLIAIALAQVLLPRPIEFDATTPSLMWLIRTDAICFGAVLALWKTSTSYEQMKPHVLARSKPLRIVITSLLVLVLAVAAAPGLSLSRPTGVIAVVSALLVWIASYNAEFILPQMKSIEPILQWLGSRSYSLYLIHETVGRLSSELRARIDSASGAVGVIVSMLFTVTLTLLLSEMNYRFVELPLRRIGRTIAESERRKADGAVKVVT